MTDITPQARPAEQFLERRLRLVHQLKYTSKFRTSRGRHMMLNRRVGFIGVFVERDPVAAGVAGVRLNVHKQCLGHYDAKTPRASSVRKDSRLGIQNEAFYVRCESMGALERLVSWYEQQ